MRRFTARPTERAAAVLAMVPVLLGAPVPIPVRVTNVDYRAYLATLTAEERAALASGTHLYEVEFRNLGGLVMPILLELEYEDGTREMRRIPAEVWRYTPDRVTKVFATSKPVRAFTLDPNQETADTELANNRFPRVPVESRFQVFKRQDGTIPNPMQLDRAHPP